MYMHTIFYSQIQDIFVGTFTWALKSIKLSWHAPGTKKSRIKEWCKVPRCWARMHLIGNSTQKSMSFILLRTEQSELNHLPVPSKITTEHITAWSQFWICLETQPKKVSTPKWSCLFVFHERFFTQMPSFIKDLLGHLRTILIWLLFSCIYIYLSNCIIRFSLLLSFPIPQYC